MDSSVNENISSAKAVLLGALAPGVNGATWSVLKLTFITLGVCLAAMLGLAFTSSDLAMSIHVALLVIISTVLFLLLNRLCLSSFYGLRGSPGVDNHLIQVYWALSVMTLLTSFLVQTGFVAVEDQMKELGLASKIGSSIDEGN